jgi:hypothetical protein
MTVAPPPIDTGQFTALKGGEVINKAVNKRTPRLAPQSQQSNPAQKKQNGLRTHKIQNYCGSALASRDILLDVSCFIANRRLRIFYVI